MGSVFPNDSAWRPVNIGAGGYITGIDVAPDGTMVMRTDTYGAYIWNGTGWTQMVTASSMPDGIFYSTGVYEIRVAASNSNIMYMHMGDGLYKTADKGATWTKTAFPIEMDYVHSNRVDGQKMAIDPSNPNIVFAGTDKQGLWVTRDGGSTWQKIAAVPQGTSPNGTDFTGITIKGSTVYVGTGGNGVYTSTDGGFTWKAIGGPSDVGHAVLSADGSYYATENGSGALWKYANGSWTKLISDSVHTVAIDPFNAKHLMVTTPGGSLQESLDGGATWSGWNVGTQLEASSDIPWLEHSGLYMSSGDMVFDPLVPGKLWQAAGVGVWETTLTGKLVWNMPVVWNSHSMGIEQLVANEILAPAGVDPLFASWDRPFFSMPNLDEFATSYSGGEFSMGWSVDYASTNPTFMVGISDWWGQENSGFSTDGGKTWQKFAGLPSSALNSVGGSIAASTPTNFIWAATGSAPAYTLDGGKTWTDVVIPGVTNWSQSHHAYYLCRTTITADRVNPNTFYLYDVGSGMYRTTDGGVTWTKMHTGLISDWSYWNSKIEAVPGSAGELYFTAGPQGGDATQAPPLIDFKHSTDGGATWQAIAGVKVSTFGFGAAASPGGPATVYIVGTVEGKYGIWYSADGSKTWTQIGERPMGSLDNIKSISGDMDHFGLVYVGFGGSGFAYLDIGGAPPVTEQPPSSPPNQVAMIATAVDDVGGAAVVVNGALINDSTPTLSGTLSSVLTGDQKLVVYRDGQLIGQLSPTTTAWSLTDPGAADGVHIYTVRVENGAGQAGNYSAGFRLTIDTAAPKQQVSITGASLEAAAPASSGSGIATQEPVLSEWSTMRAFLADREGYNFYSTGSSTTVTMAEASTSPTQGSTGAEYSLITGTISGTLAADETLIVFRDGVRIGVGTVSASSWSFTDSVTSGSYNYTARVQDSAGNLGSLSNAFTASLGGQVITGTARKDVLVGGGGSDTISGVPASGTKLGKGTIDILTGGGGSDLFVLGDARGRFYDDGSSRSAGTADYARITDFAAGDKLQLKGSPADYLQSWVQSLDGASGTGIYHDSNGNGSLDNRDELIALVQNHGPIDPSNFLFV